MGHAKNGTLCPIASTVEFGLNWEVPLTNCYEDAATEREREREIMEVRDGWIVSQRESATVEVRTVRDYNKSKPDPI